MSVGLQIKIHEIDQNLRNLVFVTLLIKIYCLQQNPQKASFQNTRICTHLVENIRLYAKI